VSDEASPKTVDASSKLTPCLERLDCAFRESHSNVRATNGYYFAIQTFFGSVKNRSASPPRKLSGPTVEIFAGQLISIYKRSWLR